MFSCSACLQRAVKNLFADLPNTAVLPARPRRKQAPLTTAHHLLSRSRSTIQSIKKGHHRRVLLKAFNSDRPVRPNKSRNGLPSKALVRDTLARENNRRHLNANEDSTASKTKLQLQLQWLQDPVKLASAVLDRLRIGDDKGALELIRGSERALHGRGEESGSPVSNVVSWNHVMDWNMHKGDTREAKKVYNEMKKRGHRPDAHTYTIMLRGFAANANKPNAVTDAVSVYNSIFSPNSAVKPNTIHTNAAINVCAKGGDMDSLWSIAGKLPEKGVGAADKWTYSCILNALRADAEKRAAEMRDKDGNEEASDKIIDEVIADGENLWQDVAKKWRAGDLTVDESLTCAMGRLLLLSKRPGHWKNVFTLVEQTMRVPTWKTKSLLLVTSSSENSPEVDEDLAEKSANALEVPNHENFSPVPIGIQVPDSLSTKPSSLYAIPGNNVLSMLLQAATLTGSLRAGKYYWDTLTEVGGAYKVQYDVENLSQYLRLLRISRSSRAVRDLLSQAFTEDQADSFLKRGIFVIAMSTCIRDKDNPNVFEHASSIFDQMLERLDQPDAKIMDMYVDLAILTTPGLGYTEGKFEPHPHRNNAMNAIARLGPITMAIKGMIKEKIDEEEFEALPARRKKVAEKGRQDLDLVHQPKEVLSGYLTSLISAYDKLLAKKELPESFRKEYILQRKRVAAFVTKMLASPFKRITPYKALDGESHSKELDQQERRSIDRARGFKGPKKFHDRTDEYMRNEERKWDRDAKRGRAPPRERLERENPFPAYQDAGKRGPSFQKGWGGGFEDLARKEGKGAKSDFADIRA